MADASVLGIHPPSMVRIIMEDGWTQDWPWEWVQCEGDRILIAPDGDPVIYYPYEHYRFFPLPMLFYGRENFTVTAGPPQPASVN